MRRGAIVIAALAVAAAGAVARSPRAHQDGFPHADHAGLFPTCVGCHAGLETGEESEYYTVTAADCAECHDGAREREVEWREPARRTTNLAFSHREHIGEVAEAGDTALACGGCHRIAGREERMAVAAATPESCLGCHAHAAAEHLAVEVRCSACHVPLARATALPGARVESFPEPATHDSEEFLFEHAADPTDATARAESCAVCHARESCTRCHINRDAVPQIASLPTDPRVAQLVAGRPGEWPEPEDHESPTWLVQHGSEATGGIGGCANCHAEASCRTCHGAARIPELGRLPSPAPPGPAGAVVEAGRPPGHVPAFTTRHGSAVAAGLPKCAACHVERECATCHEQPLPLSGKAEGRDEAPGYGWELDSSPAAPEERTGAAWRDASEARARDRRPGYHPTNFVLRHGEEAFSAQTACSDCHTTEAFCTGCHQAAGFALGAGAGAGGAFHDTQPNWIIGHGQAARQGMEACASCHRQSSCLRCHSARFGLRINPHGPSFDADRVADRSTMSCGICHFAAQLESR